MITDSSLKEELQYRISEFSSYTKDHHPNNIRIESPENSDCRWTSAKNNSEQYLTLRLLEDAIVTGIYFGKYKKSHICNLKRFNVYSIYQDKFFENIGVCTCDCCVRYYDKDIPFEFTSSNKDLVSKSTNDFDSSSDSSSGDTFINGKIKIKMPQRRIATDEMDCKSISSTEDSFSDISQIEFDPKNNQKICSRKKVAVNKSPVLVFNGGLKNNNVGEYFTLDITHKNCFLVTNEIKISPISSYGSNYSFSIWNVKLFGVRKKEILRNVNLYNANQIFIYCKNHIDRIQKTLGAKEVLIPKNHIDRIQKTLGAKKVLIPKNISNQQENQSNESNGLEEKVIFTDSISTSWGCPRQKVCDNKILSQEGANTNIATVKEKNNADSTISSPKASLLEESFSNLHIFDAKDITVSGFAHVLRDMVIKKNFAGIESLFLEALDRNLISAKLRKNGHYFEQIKPCSGDPWPQERGGFASIIKDNMLYISGGWCGSTVLNDLWAFNCETQKFIKSSFVDTERSCHQMLYLENNEITDPGSDWLQESEDFVYYNDKDANSGRSSLCSSHSNESNDDIDMENGTTAGQRTDIREIRSINENIHDFLDNRISVPSDNSLKSKTDQFDLAFDSIEIMDKELSKINTIKKDEFSLCIGTVDPKRDRNPIDICEHGHLHDSGNRDRNPIDICEHGHLHGSGNRDRNPIDICEHGHLHDSGNRDRNPIDICEHGHLHDSVKLTSKGDRESNLFTAEKNISRFKIDVPFIECQNLTLRKPVSISTCSSESKTKSDTDQKVFTPSNNIFIQICASDNLKNNQKTDLLDLNIGLDGRRCIETQANMKDILKPVKENLEDVILPFISNVTFMSQQLINQNLDMNSLNDKENHHRNMRISNFPFNNQRDERKRKINLDPSAQNIYKNTVSERNVGIGKYYTKDFYTNLQFRINQLFLLRNEVIAYQVLIEVLSACIKILITALINCYTPQENKKSSNIIDQQGLNRNFQVSPLRNVEDKITVLEDTYTSKIQNKSIMKSQYQIWNINQLFNQHIHGFNQDQVKIHSLSDLETEKNYDKYKLNVSNLQIHPLTKNSYHSRVSKTMTSEICHAHPEKLRSGENIVKYKSTNHKADKKIVHRDNVKITHDLKNSIKEQTANIRSCFQILANENKKNLNESLKYPDPRHHVQLNAFSYIWNNSIALKSHRPFQSPNTQSNQFSTQRYSESSESNSDFHTKTGKESSSDSNFFSSDEETTTMVEEDENLQKNRSQNSFLKKTKGNVSPDDGYLFIFGGYIPKSNFPQKISTVKFYLHKMERTTSIHLGGPRNLFDNQCVSFDNQILLFGGKIQKSHKVLYCEFLKFMNNRFYRLNDRRKYRQRIETRVGHSMNLVDNEKSISDWFSFDPNRVNHNINALVFPKRFVVIIGGSIENKFFYNITYYDIEENTVFKTVKLPKEIKNRIMVRSQMVNSTTLYIMFCFNSDHIGQTNEMVIYKYDIYNFQFEKVTFSSKKKPVPRSAHCFVYNEKDNCIYIFAGNESRKLNSRLNDMWRLVLPRMNIIDMEKKYLLRKIRHIFARILRNGGSLQANKYIRKNLHCLYDLSDPEDASEFKTFCVNIYNHPDFYSVEAAVSDLRNLLSFGDENIETLYKEIYQEG